MREIIFAIHIFILLKSYVFKKVVDIWAVAVYTQIFADICVKDKILKFSHRIRVILPIYPREMIQPSNVERKYFQYAAYL